LGLGINILGFLAVISSEIVPAPALEITKSADLNKAAKFFK